MSLKLDRAIEDSGTRFKVFPQPPYLAGFEAPELVRISVPSGQVGPGPTDERMVVVDAIGKTPYDYPYLPPHIGPAMPPVQPDARGHFDHLEVGTRDFQAAHMYAVVRRALDIWEDYLDERIDWHFSLTYARLELIPLIAWDNAQSGYGFLEFGYGRKEDGSLYLERPYCLNFDVLAHELGHGIVSAQLGDPDDHAKTAEFDGFHESCGDLVALVASLHFGTMVDTLPKDSKGNLFSTNELSRVGELSAVRQIRNAFNYERMSTVSHRPHDLSQPLTGAIFDVFVETFQKCLVEKNLISRSLVEKSYHLPHEAIDDAAIQAAFAAAYAGKEADFKQCLLETRDDLGRLLAQTWKRSSPDYLTFEGIGKTLLQVDREVSGGGPRRDHTELLFLARDRPQLRDPGASKLAHLRVRRALSLGQCRGGRRAPGPQFS